MVVVEETASSVARGEQPRNDRVRRVQYLCLRRDADAAETAEATLREELLVERKIKHGATVADL